MKILTANHLATGDVVYLSTDGWRPFVHEARIADNDDKADELVSRGNSDARANIVVEPYLIEVECHGDLVVPVHYREKFRASGPSVRTDLGKQAVRQG
ncbi:MAG: DUF2849 domain-containing protein [Geminicoccaceae bacterium]|nr:DUF2849 domain-containing protein [Geminicoccaceae bacterium]